MVVTYSGDVLTSGSSVVAHQVNCRGVMGAGVARAIRQKYPNAYTSYKALCKKMEPKDLLGQIQPCICAGAKERWIVNCFGQDNFGTDKRYTDYEALQKCFTALRNWAIHNGHKKIAMPYGIGCGLAGGDWNIVYKMLKDIFCDNKVDVEIWKLPEGRPFRRQ